jgi:hypothetical protein
LREFEGARQAGDVLDLILEPNNARDLRWEKENYPLDEGGTKKFDENEIAGNNLNGGRSKT